MPKPASFPVVLGDFGCDVTCQACRENSHSVPSLGTRLCQSSWLLGSSPTVWIPVHTTPKCDRNYPICNAPLSPRAPLQKSHRNHRSFEWTEAVRVRFSCRQVLSTIVRCEQTQSDHVRFDLLHFPPQPLTQQCTPPFFAPKFAPEERRLITKEWHETDCVTCQKWNRQFIPGRTHLP